MIKRIFKWLLVLLIIVLVLLLIAVGVAYFFAGTDRGFRYATEEAVSRVDGLEVENSSGNLKSGVSAAALKYENDTILVKATDVETRWRTGCLLDREFCLDKVFVDELYLEPKATETNEQEPEPADRIELPTIELPIALNAEEIIVKKLRLNLPGTDKEHVLTDVTLRAFTPRQRSWPGNLLC